ncbi:MAG: hypothetical protein DELT_00078 [Desulfovibrio sp.]
MKRLEPVVKRKSSFSILLLRDDSGVVRFRLKPFWLKFFICIFILFSGASGAAGYAAHYYWKKYNNLQQERSQLSAELKKSSRILDELNGIERVEAALPRSSMSSVSVAVANGGNAKSQNGADSAGTGSNGNGNGVKQPQAGQPPAQNQESSGQQAGSAPKTEAVPSSAANSGQGALAPPVSVEGSGTTPPSAAGAQPDETQTAVDPTEKKEHPAFIDELQIRLTGAKRYNLSFGLSNRDKQIKLNGRVHLAVSAKNGKRYEITQVNRDTLRFVINNYKKVITSFTLPPELEAEDAARLHLTVTAEDVPNITYSFLMPPPVPPAPARPPAESSPVSAPVPPPASTPAPTPAPSAPPSTPSSADQPVS